MSAADERAGRSDAPTLVELLALIAARAPHERVEAISDFARAFVRRLSRDAIVELSAEALFGRVMGAFELADGRGGEPTAVRAFDPTSAIDGYSATGSIVETNCLDIPFLVESVGNALRARELEVELLVHPVVGTERDADGRIVRIEQVRGASSRESVMHFEVDRHLSPSLLGELETEVARVLGDVQVAVRDFGPMQERVGSMIEAVQAGRLSPVETEDGTTFLRWLLDDNFILLGFREYAVAGDTIKVVPGRGLGILADDSTSRFSEPRTIAGIPEHLRERLLGQGALVISKTNSLSTVHRLARMDDIAVRRTDAQGRISGVLRLIGLFTAQAYMEPARETPILSRKLRQIVEAEDFLEDSHDYREVAELFDSFPKDELFAASVEDLRRTLVGLLQLREQDEVTLFVRRDIPDRRVAILVALPRERFDAELRQELQSLFVERFRPASIEYHLSLGESELARIHFTLRFTGEIPEVSHSQLEQEVASLTRTWDDRLRERLVVLHGAEEGVRLAETYAVRFSDAYKAERDVLAASFDVEQFERLDGEPFVFALRNERAEGESVTRVGLYRRGGKARLSDVLPLLEHLGLTVIEEVPTRLNDERDVYLHDFGVVTADGQPLDLAGCGERVAECMAAVVRGEADSDSLNRLVVSAALTWRQVGVLRAYRTYRLRLGAAFGVEYENEAFARNPYVPRALVQLFELRFDPTKERDLAAEEALRAELLDALDAVVSLDEDRILRAYLGLIEATLRTSYFRPGRAYLSFKLASAQVPGMPKPVPLYEIFVYSRTMEGIHLRGGKIARGGIRWSDRKEDYRTEILDLMQTQMVKNAVIVPVGSKGGFVLKRDRIDPKERAAEVREQYATLMRGLLDLTDNLVEGKVVHPPDVRVLDEDDPYLVVAADKGTATFSDAANAIAQEYGFWLGDAFASGGSHGYDHKALGITARGAWESVKRHFRELGRDADAEEITVVGIGDMSGDVFGNGMLLSGRLRLLAAFDHRHVFVDPDPDPELAFAERKRLFELPGSSWDDYDRTTLSTGGGVWPRSAKSIELSNEAQRALDVEAAALTPGELIVAILKAPVDLLWNGGIGTFVKSSEESHTAVGDRTNDAIRVNGSDLRARVVGEGGNLGFTQKGRIEYALAGGRINTDAIDNSAGVDLSDHEVNLKVLLGMAIESGDLTLKQRDDLLREAQDNVAAHVLYDNYLQAQILSQEALVSAKRSESYEDLMVQLERDGLLDRALEDLPSTEVMAERAASGHGMVRPELSVLLAYAKRSLKEGVRRSALPDDSYLDRELCAYFPASIVERFEQLAGAHPLRRDLVSTIVANDVVNALGITWAARLALETGADSAQVARAFWIARELVGAKDRWAAVEALDSKIDAALQNELMVGVDTLVEEIARWYLLNEPGAPIGGTIETGAPDFAALSDVLERTGSEAWRAERLAAARTLEQRGVPSELALRHIFQVELVHGPNVMAVAKIFARPLDDVTNAFFLGGERLQLDWLEQRLSEVPQQSRWQRWASQAIRDDLLGLRRDAATRILAREDAVSVDSQLMRFLDERRAPLERLGRLISTLAAQEEASLAALTIAVRQARRVVS